MKRRTMVLVAVGWLLLIGLAVARAPSSSAPALADATVTPLIPGPYPTARVPNELTYYTKRCWPACHYDSAWLSEEPPSTTETFDSAPSSSWGWINGEDGDWSLEETPGALHIAAPAGSGREKGGGLEDVPNVLVREAPQTHFDVMARVTFDPAVSAQSAGVVVEMDDGSVISVERGSCGEGYDSACVGEGVYFDGLGADCAFEGVPVSSDMVDLMLRRAGNSYIGYYRVSEGREAPFPTHMGWEEVGRCYNREVAPERVGLMVSNDGRRAAAADFEQVTVVERK